MIATHALSLLGAGLGASLAMLPGDWPHLRGPDLDGQAVSSVFERGNFGLEVAWKKTLGSGYSGITVADGTLVTMFSDGKDDVVVALDADTGAERWRYAVEPTYPGVDGADDGPISTPLIHDGRVHVIGARGRLVTLSLDRGAALWSHDLVTEYGSTKPDYGFATTAVADGDVVVVQAGGPDGRSLCGFDARTGDLRWSSGDEPLSYQSPVIMTLAGRRQVVAFAGPAVTGHDPQTGEQLWRMELGRRDQGGSAVPGRVGENRFLANVRSGVLTFEVRKSDTRGDAYKVEIVGRCRQLGDTYAPPVRFGRHLYGFRGDFLTCADAETGRRVWKSRPPGGKGLILVNDRLVIFGALGRLVVAAATPDGYREEASLEVFDGSAFTWPSFADDRILLRNPREIVSVRVVEGRGPAVVAASVVEPPSGGVVGDLLRHVAAAANESDRDAVVAGFMRAAAGPVIEGDKVTFVYQGDVEDVAVAGTMIDASRPEPMFRVAGTDLFHRTYRIEPGSRVEYRFQVDLDEWETDPRNPRTVPSDRGRGELSELVMPGYEVAAHVDPPSHDRRGRVETFEHEDAPTERKRNVQVYLPAAYDAEPERRFPLLVVQDGSSWVDKGLMVNTLDNVIGERVEPVVVAFVDTIGMWWLEAGGTQTAEFTDMLADRLVPELERRYRLRSDASARAVLGVRDYGLSAAYAVLKRPDVFGRAAVQSVALRNGAEVELMELIEQRPPRGVAFYVDWNLYESRSADEGFDFGADSRRLAAALESGGYECAGGQARDSFGWASFRSRADRILETFFPADETTRRRD